MAANADQEPVVCAGCGRTFDLRAVGSRGRCVYCGGELRGPGLPRLALVSDSEPTEEAVPPAERARRGKARARGVKVLRGSGPSRWDQPTSLVQEGLALGILALGAALATGLGLRDHPALPPRTLLLAAALVLPIALAGGRVLAWSLDLLRAGARSVLLAIPLLAVGMALGLPGALARTLSRASPRLFGIWGFLVALTVAAAGFGWLDRRHDPWRHAREVAARGTDDPRRRADFLLTPMGWAGEVPEVAQGAFALRVERVAEGEAWGSLTWVDRNRADPVHAAWAANHLAFAYPGPPDLSPVWRRANVGSTLDLWIGSDGRIVGQDSLFGTKVEAGRAWQQDPEARERGPATPLAAGVGAEAAPVVQGPVVLRPLVPVEDEEVSTGRAFALRPQAGADPVLVTAASLFSPVGGLARPVIPAMLPALAQEAHFFDLTTGAMRARGRLGPPPRGAHALTASADGPPDASGDVIAFAILPGSSVAPLALRSEPVHQGLGVWLPLRPDDPQGGEERLQAGKVTAAWEQGFSVQFGVLPPLGELVGAPLLDGRGEVAGMLVGTQTAGDRALGVAIPAGWIAARLAP